MLYRWVYANSYYIVNIDDKYLMTIVDNSNIAFLPIGKRYRLNATIVANQIYKGSLVPLDDPNDILKKILA